MTRARHRAVHYCLTRANRSPSATTPDESPLSAYGHPRSAGQASCHLVEGLRLTRVSRPGEPAGFAHAPVMAEEVAELFDTVPPGLVVDATVGGGGHAALLLARRPDIEVLGIDRDPEAISASRRTLARFGDRVQLFRGRFDRITEAVSDSRREDGGESRSEISTPGTPGVSGVLFDLGVSSFQFDAGRRGFSYRFEAPLDMRMDPDSPLSAFELVNEWPAEDLAAIFSENGETVFAWRIARAIVSGRPIRTTTELAEVVRNAVPAAQRRRGHPAKRVFQALRIAVNEETEQLGPALSGAIDLLVPGGRLVILSYHSGEDRLVKDTLRGAASGNCTCPPGLPCVCGAAPRVRLLNRGARLASAAETASNPRASSARLRAAEKLETS